MDRSLDSIGSCSLDVDADSSDISGKYLYGYLCGYTYNQLQSPCNPSVDYIGLISPNCRYQWEPELSNAGLSKGHNTRIYCQPSGEL